MPSELPASFLARHGDTAWTESRQHTARTDLPLNERGEERARQIGERLQRFSFARVFTRPLQRASRTCELAGFGAILEVDPDLVEVRAAVSREDDRLGRHFAQRPGSPYRRRKAS